MRRTVPSGEPPACINIGRFVSIYPGECFAKWASFVFLQPCPGDLRQIHKSTWRSSALLKGILVIVFFYERKGFVCRQATGPNIACSQTQIRWRSPSTLMFMEFPGVFALKENLTCSVYMSTAGVKGRGGGVTALSHWTTWKCCRGREGESNSGNMSEFISLCLQEVTMLSSGYFWPMRGSHMLHITSRRTFSESLSISAPLIRQLDGR